MVPGGLISCGWRSEQNQLWAWWGLGCWLSVALCPLQLGTGGIYCCSVSGLRTLVLLQVWAISHSPTGEIHTHADGNGVLRQVAMGTKWTLTATVPPGRLEPCASCARAPAATGDPAEMQSRAGAVCLAPHLSTPAQGTCLLELPLALGGGGPHTGVSGGLSSPPLSCSLFGLWVTAGGRVRGGSEPRVLPVASSAVCVEPLACFPGLPRTRLLLDSCWE